MHWEIRGTRNGKPGQWKLQAPTAGAARTKAEAAGVTVAQVKQLIIPGVPAEPAPAAVAEPVRHAHVAEPEPEPEQEQEQYQEPAPEPEDEPEHAVAVGEEETYEEAHHGHEHPGGEHHGHEHKHEPEQDADEESEWTHVAPAEAAPAAHAVAAPMTAPPISYAAPHAPAGAPHYNAIVAGAKVLQIFSLLFFLGALLAAVGPVLLMFLPGAGASLGPAMIVPVVSGVFSAVVLVAGGLLIRLVAAVSLAIRDIAQNSYR